MAEWLKAHDSKSCGRVDRLGSSNLPVSAIGSIEPFFIEILFLGPGVEFGEFFRFFI